MRGTVILVYFLMYSGFCFAQKLNTIYHCVSSDSLHAGHQLEFENDSSLEVSTFPRHMSKQFRLHLMYKKTGGILEIFAADISDEDSIALVNNGFSQYLHKTALRIEGKALTDDLNNIVYVLDKDFRKKYYLTYLIDNKTYKQETGLSDAYGLVKNKGKENKALHAKLSSIKDDLKNYDIKIYKGLEAYKRFGYSSVFGVIELKHKM
jgi:hypothetical protein